MGDAELADNEYRCGQCKEICTKGWSDEERDAEALDNGFDLSDPDDLVIVCDDCYQQMAALIPPKIFNGVESPQNN